MANLSMIDPAKPLRLAAFSRSQVTNPVLKKLAISMSMPQMLDIDEPTASAVPLSITETGNFIVWLLSTPWGKRLEENLQCMSQDQEGHPFLTSWVAAGDFKQLVLDARGSTFAQLLQRSYDAWTPLGMNTVYFDGYRLGDIA